ncbi:MAG: 30S ribosomal protein S9 [Candidatus Micrarchaeota archaeon]|nr:30S ribosomal protein S9 [Candidatus Micrarchaeota archaeon]
MAEREAVIELTKTPAAQPAAAAETAVKKKAAPKRRASKKGKVVFVKSKRKTAVARASIKAGSGRIRVNSFDINTIQPIELRKIMLEPIELSNNAAQVAKGVDISVNVYGGGQSSQAQAVRGAIAKGISQYAETDVIKNELMKYDRAMLVDDSRRVEPKKFKGPKARARFQKSYR